MNQTQAIAKLRKILGASKPLGMKRYLNGELIRVEPGREGSPVAHIVWDSYAQREVRIYPRAIDVEMLVKRDEWQALSPDSQQALTEMAGRVRDTMTARNDEQRAAVERIRNVALGLGPRLGRTSEVHMKPAVCTAPNCDCRQGRDCPAHPAFIFSKRGWMWLAGLAFSAAFWLWLGWALS